jgi:hypothetical protein
MSGYRSGRPFYLVCCLLAVILFGCYVMFNGFQDDNSATMAPNLTIADVSRALSLGAHRQAAQTRGSAAPVRTRPQIAS